MAKSTGIILAAGSITLGNEWIHKAPTPTLVRIGLATAGATVLFAGLEHIPGGEPAAVGIAVIALIAVLAGGITPGVPSPAVQLLEYINPKPPPKS
jgi:hypothetical protein